MNKHKPNNEFDGSEILIVDDYPENLQLLSSFLKSLGCSVRTAVNGKLAIQSVQNNPPELILLDIMMPGMNGYEVASALKDDPMTADIPIIFISALTDVSERVEAFDVGGVDYISKPFQLAEVIARVKTHLRLYTQQREIQRLYQRDHELVTQLQYEIEQRTIAERERYKLWTAVEQSANSIIITDTEGRIEYVNPKFVSITGYSRAEVMGKNLNILKSGFTTDQEYANLWTTIQQGHVWHGSFHNRRKDGSLFWELVSISPIRGDDGEIINYLAVKEDITARRETEAALYEAMQRITLMNRIISSTNAIKVPQHMLDVAAEEIYIGLGARWVMIAPIDHEYNTLTISVQYPYGTKPDLREYSLPLTDCPTYKHLLKNPIPYVAHQTETDDVLPPLSMHLGKLPVKTTMVIPMFAHEQMIAMIFVCYDKPTELSPNDITLAGEIGQAASQSYENSLLHARLQKHNDDLTNIVQTRTEQLDRLNQRMAAVLGSISDGIVLVSREGAINNTNNGFDEMFGIYPDALFGQPLTRLCRDEDKPILEAHIRNAGEGIANKPIQVNVWHQDDHHWFDVEISISPVGNEAHNLVCTFHDISAHKEAERMKDNFVSMVTHELRTPLTSMMLISNGLEKYYARMDDEKRVYKISQLNKQVNVLAELVESVLDISRLTLPSHRQLTEVNLPDIGGKVCEELYLSAKDKMIDLHFEQDKTPIIKGDHVEFARIWRNLISNAIKYTANGGHVKILSGSLQVHQAAYDWSPSLLLPPHFQYDLEDGLYAVGQVADDGHGIAPDDLAQLFTRFHRGWAKSSNIQGSGLGLSLVRELIDLYGGGIHVHSELGVGSIFTFWIASIALKER